MNHYFISKIDLDSYLNTLMQKMPIIGPVLKEDHFIFSELSTVSELRLDYDVTLMPPKVIFFPPGQKLLEFKDGKVKNCINPRKQILMGVHFYDIKGLDMLDQLFSQNHVDQNYMANRNQTIVVGSNIQKIAKHAFWDSVGTELDAKGHDAFLTDLSPQNIQGYLLQTLTDKANELVVQKYLKQATPTQIQSAKQINDSVMGKCPEQITKTSAEVAQTMRAAFKNEAIWDKLAKDCFSCGACNIVCSTCYCFDVQDHWNDDQESCQRCRNWDACMTEDFAKVSLGGGNSENFRESRASRYRHRMMRKTSYLNDQLGSPACVGCGRCSTSCVPDIANPVKIINRIFMENEP